MCVLLINRTVSDVKCPHGPDLSPAEGTSSSYLWPQWYIAWFPIWALQTPGGMASSAFSLFRVFLQIIKSKLPLGGHRPGQYTAWPGNSSFVQRKSPHPFWGRCSLRAGPRLRDRCAGWTSAALAPQPGTGTAQNAMRPAPHGGPGRVAVYERKLETISSAWCIFLAY